MVRRLTLALCLLSLPLPVGADELRPEFETDVFVSGSEGYHTFRIPAAIVTSKGTLLAFCEGRRNSRSDTGDIDLVLRRSTDGGRTWSKMQVVWDDAANTCGNPCPVVDEATGRIWLPMTWNDGRDGEAAIRGETGRDTRRVFITWSDDDGLTWAEPAEITETAKRPDWTWYATGPGNGIQLRHGPHKGRLVIPCDHNVTTDGQSVRRSHCIYSDDGGKSWQISGSLGDLTNECAVAELTDGRLQLNMRSYHGRNRRAVSHSRDGGRSWSPLTFDETLIEPVCQGSLVRYTWPDDGGRSRLLFSNPASTKRERMTVRLSYDEGRTWPVSRLVYAGSAAYSSLTPLPDRTVGLLYERDNYATITFTAFTLEQLTGGKDSLPPRP